MRKTFIFIIGSLLVCQVGYTEPSKDLMDYFQKELGEVHDAIQSCEADPVDRMEVDSHSNESWFYRNFWLRIQGRVTFQVAEIAKIELVPEVEALWQRALPSGWSNYKPAVEQPLQ